MKISVLTPSIREHSLELVRESLAKQTFREFEWLVCSRFPYLACDKWISERPYNPGDFWGYSKAMNDLLKAATGDLIVLSNDSQYLKSNVLDKFWRHYEENNKDCVAGLGYGYKRVINGQGENLVFDDARFRRYLAFSPATEIDFDTGLCSIPASAIKQVGGIYEPYDKVCCFGDRELMVRIRNVGYNLMIDPLIKFIGQKHEKTQYDPNNIWDEKFREGERMYNERIEKML